jgi:type I restriction enzyme S subunit
VSAEEQGSLPAGWTRVRFGDVVGNKNLTTKDPQKDGLDRIVGLTHLDSERLPVVRWDLLEGETSFSRTFTAGDVLFGKRRAYQRKVGVPDFAGICSGDILVFESKNPSLLQEFLPYIVQSDAFFQHALGTSAGSLSPRTNWTQLARFEFALPPLEEQKRTVQILSAISQASSSYALVEDAAKSLLLSLGQELFARESTARLSDLVEVRLGRQRSPKTAAGDHMTPYIRAANVKHGALVLDDVKVMDFSPQEQQTYALRVGDVLVSEGSGGRDEVGASCRWLDEASNIVCFQNTVLRLRPIEDSGVSSDLVWFWADYAFRSGIFRSIATGTSIWHLSAARVKKLPFPPAGESVDEQLQKLRVAEASLAAAKQARADSQRTLAAAREELLRMGS